MNRKNKINNKLIKKNNNKMIRYKIKKMKKHL